MKSRTKILLAFEHRLADLLQKLAHTDFISSLQQSEQDYYYTHKKTQKQRDQFLIARYLLRQMLRSYAGEVQSAKFTFSKNFKPELRLNGQEHFISITHSGNLIAVAIANNPIGIDLELCQERANYAKIARRYFSVDEISRIKSLRDFYRVWTSKEAMLKQQGMFVAKISRFEPAGADCYSQYLQNNLDQAEYVLSLYSKGIKDNPGIMNGFSLYQSHSINSLDFFEF